MNISRKQKHREQICGCQGGGNVGERIESLELADANQYVQKRETTRSYYIAQGTITTYIKYPVINQKGKEYEKEYLYELLSNFAVQQKITHHCKSTILQ